MAPSWKRRTAAVTTRGRDDPESVWKIPSAARHVRLTAKDRMILLSRNHFITRGDIRDRGGERRRPILVGQLQLRGDVLQCDDNGLGEFRTRALKQAWSGARRSGA